MSDQRLRELERAWQGGGGVEDEAALLRERLRRGVTDEARLEVAARLGHAASAAVLGPRAPGPGHADERLRLAALDAAIGRVGQEARVRAAIALARLRARAWGHARKSGRVDSANLLRALEAAEGWARCPCADHAADASVAAERARAAVWRLRARTQRSAGFAVLAGDAAARPGGRPLRLEDAADQADEVRAALRQELVPWLLGHADPVAARG
ncbi:MAG: hypothetical protein M9894_03845 [Planctomycetes bacterium]|nr:hypothetical protein [Planctomycetota bacterium]